MAAQPRPLPWTHGVRALACLAVLMWHALLTILPSDASPTQRLYVLPLGVMAREAVLVFIVLSGYLLGRHWKGGLSGNATMATFRRYLGRRLWRIVPPFWAAVTVTVLAMLLLGLRHPEGSHWDTGLPFTPWRTVANYLMITDLVGINPLNHPLWTVPVELHLYLAAPIVVALALRSRVIVVAGLATVLIAFLAPTFTAPYFVFAFMTAFWTGARRQDVATTTVRDTARLMAPMAVVSALLLVVVTGGHPLPDGPDKYFVTDALFAPVFLGWLFHRDVLVRSTYATRLLSARPLEWIGERSYSLYLLHGLVLEITWRFLTRPLGLQPKELHMLVLLLLGGLFSVIAADLLYRVVEAPSARRSAALGRLSTPVTDHPPSQSTTKESR